jgi:hypothetical protein
LYELPQFLVELLLCAHSKHVISRPIELDLFFERAI